METSAVQFLDWLAARTLLVAAIAFVVVNGAFLAAIATTRSRGMVDTWVPRLVATDVVLLAAGAGVPLVAAMARFAVRAIAALASSPVVPPQ